MEMELSTGKRIPLEMHQVRIVRNISLLPARERLAALREAGFNTFCLQSKEVFIDMLTDSGTNAMSDRQLSAMMIADDAYAGSESMVRLRDSVSEILGLRHILPVHQGRAAEHIISRTFVKPGQVVVMNYHFTTSKVHVLFAGGVVEELCMDEALETQSDHPFKGNMDIAKLEASIKRNGREKIAFIRMEATTNLLGGQPFSMANLREVCRIAKENNIMTVMDGSLIAENALFIKEREQGFENRSVKDIILEMVSLSDIFYFSGRKSSSSRGGIIGTNNLELFELMKPLLPVFEGFFTYGGMSSKEMEAMAVGIREMADLNVVENVVAFVRFFANECIDAGLPVVTPPGGLACHLDARRFLPHLDQSRYPAGALAAAAFLVSGVRGMERGTISMERNPDGSEAFADIELLRLAVPRRVFTMSHVLFAVDRLKWLFKNRDLIGGLRFTEEPTVLRFFVGKLAPDSDWDTRLIQRFEMDFGEGRC